jgi:hypothetical protein
MRGYGIQVGLEAGLWGCECEGLGFVVAVGEDMGGEKRMSR